MILSDKSIGCLAPLSAEPGELASSVCVLMQMCLQEWILLA